MRTTQEWHDIVNCRILSDLCVLCEHQGRRSGHDVDRDPLLVGQLESRIRSEPVESVAAIVSKNLACLQP